MTKFRVLAIAVATGKIGYVLLENDKLADWGKSRAAARSPEKAHAFAKDLIGKLDPEAVVTEKPGSNRYKRGLTLALMEAVTGAVRDSSCINVTVTKERSHRDKYAEARALVRRFPELRPYLPKKPPIWCGEPRRMILFEALSLALRLRDTS